MVCEIALVFLLIMGARYWRVAPHQVILDGQNLQLNGLFKKTLPLTELSLSQLRIIDLNQEKGFRPKWRTLGMALGNLQSGWFRLHNGEKSFLLVTGKSNVIYLPTTKGFSLLFSVSHPQEFAKEIVRRAQSD